MDAQKYIFGDLRSREIVLFCIFSCIFLNIGLSMMNAHDMVERGDNS